MRRERPEIFAYQDYRQFLHDWFAFRRAGQKGFSLRALAKEAGLASGYLPMVLNGKRSLSNDAWNKLAPLLGLTARERSHFQNLLALGTSRGLALRAEALERMKRSLKFQKENPRETEVFEYLSHWHHIAIRELATLPDFQENAAWIQERLRYPVSLQEIQASLDFLLRGKFLERGPAGRIQAPEKVLDCRGEVFKVALGKYHRGWLKLAAESIDVAASEERALVGHTVGLSTAAAEEAKRILDEALTKIRDLGQAEKAGESVYHVEIALFPLAQTKRSSS